MTDSPFDLVDTLALCAGLAVMLWVGLYASRRKRPSGWPLVAVIGEPRQTIPRALQR